LSYKFIFITGCAGSGTTMMLRVLTTPRNVLSLGGNFRTVEDPLIDEFRELTRLMWDRQASFDQHLNAKHQILSVVDKIRKNFPNKNVLLHKRSAPFRTGAPDLYDIYDLFTDKFKIIVMVRNPIMTVLSTLRRRQISNLRSGAIVHEEQLSRLNTQLTTLQPDSYKVIRYEDYCKKPKWRGKEVAQFCGLPEGCILTGNVRHKVNSNRLEIPDTKEVKLLNQHFTNFEERWPYLFIKRRIP
jgi:hypothetical protein